MHSNLDWCCIAAVNDEAVFEANLAASPALVRGRAQLTVLRDQPTAGTAYNTGLDKTRANICVFSHQDVYLPTGWDDQLQREIEKLNAIDPNWGVAGVYGIALDGAHAGRVWSTGLQREIGTSSEAPVAAQSFDELLVVLNRKSGLRFDADLPSFHLYGMDIAQNALSKGFGAYVIDAPVVHNSIPTRTLLGGFRTAYNYARAKWRNQLPIQTPVTRITWHGINLLWQQFRGARYHAIRLEFATENPRPNPVDIAKSLGYE
jgi:hypothetical protein